MPVLDTKIDNWVINEKKSSPRIVGNVPLDSRVKDQGTPPSQPVEAPVKDSRVVRATVSTAQS